MRRPRLVLSSLITLLVLLGVPVWLTWRAVRQERLDRALITAVKSKDTQSVLSLLTRGADANARDLPPDNRPFWRILLAGFKNRQPQSSAPTALLLAVGSAGNDGGLSDFDPAEETVQALLKFGADVNVKDAKGNTPLILAARLIEQDVNARMVKLLLDRGADINARGAEGMTALDFVAAFDLKPIAGMLLQHRPDVNLKDASGWTALTFAVKTGDLALIKRLLDCGADVENKDQDGTPTLQAVFSEGRDVPYSPEVVKLLLDRGANINERDRDGETLLMSAAEMGDDEIVRVLIQRGANLNLKTYNDRGGETALALARRALRDDKNDPDYSAAALRHVIKLFKRAGAKE